MIFPENTVWFVRAIPAGSMPVEGSAVAIRLQRVVSQPDGSKQGDPNTARTYLLTCAHVLRGKASWHQEGKVEGTGYGAIAPETSIKVWPPGVGLTDDQAKAVRVCRDLRRINEREILVEQRNSHVEDWVVLELVDDNAAQEDGLFSDDWFGPTYKESSLLGVGDCYWPIGYPGGNDSLRNGITHPTNSRLISLRGESEGLLLLTGDEARPGMSGGGVFSRRTFLGVVPLPWSRPRLAGIHRARDDDTMQLQALSARKIRSFIESDDVPFELCGKKPPLRNGLKMIGCIAALILMVSLLLWLLMAPTIVNVVAYEGNVQQGELLEKPYPGAKVKIQLDVGSSETGTEVVTTNQVGRGAIRIYPGMHTGPLRGYLELLPETGGATSVVYIRGEKGIPMPVDGPITLVHRGELSFIVLRTSWSEYVHAWARRNSANLRSTEAFVTARTPAEKGAVALEQVRQLALPDDVNPIVLQSAGSTVLDQFSEFAPTANESVASMWKAARGDLDPKGESDPEKSKAMEVELKQLEGLLVPALLQRRPSIPVGSNDASSQWQHAIIEGDRIAESVCYVRTRGAFTSSGFVVGEDLVMTVLFDENESFESVGFGANPEADTDPSRLGISEIIRFADQQVALLRVPKLNRPVLKFASENPFLPDRQNSVSLVGYIRPDSRMPEAFRIAISPTPETAKRIMPGICLQETAPPKPLLLHNATTSGGAAGSPMIDTSTGLVVGVHIRGAWDENGKTNQALPIWWLLGKAEISKYLQAAAVTPYGIDELRLSSDLKPLLVPLVAGLDFSIRDHETRHKEEKTIKVGPLEQKIAVYWWSVLSGTVRAQNAGENLKLSTSVSERSPTEIAVSLRLTVPLQGSVDARAETDSPRARIASVNTDYTTVANATVDARVVLSPDRGSVLAVEMPVWRTKLSETRFSQPLADRLAPVIESHVNDLIAKEMEKLLSKAKDDIGRQLKASGHE
jgi:hypothetical protein